MIVWAHHVLGLNVLVKIDQVPANNIKFGGVAEGDEQVIIDTYVELFSTPSITLLDPCKEELFRLRAEPDEVPLDSCFKLPAKGFLASVMGNSLQPSSCDERLRSSILHDMSLVTASFAFILAQYLVTDPPREARWVISNQSLLSSARFLLGSALSEASIM